MNNSFDNENKTTGESSNQYPQQTNIGADGSYHSQGNYYNDYYKAPENNNYNPQTPQEHNYNMPQQNYSQPKPGYEPYPTSSYTWNSNQVVPPNSNHNKKQGKKSGGKTALKVLSVFLCCIIASTASVFAFAGLINAGVIHVESSGDGSGAAFTITKLINNDDTSANAISGTVTQLTNQEIAQKIIPSVVLIQNYQVSSQNDFYAQFGGSTSNSGELSPAGEGSGIIISEDGYIVTNQHVIDGATSLKVVLSDGNTYEAKLIGGDSVTDLAVIKIEASGLPVAEFGSANDLSVADEVIAVGNPGGSALSSSVTIGYVSALNREITVGGYTMYCIQTDAAINPGNSGGALVNKYGQIIGINSSKIVSSGYEGLGFAIPSDTAQPIISDLINYGYVKDRAVLGISGQYIDSMTSRFYGLTTGMYVGGITSQEAQASGLQKGDVITAINGTAVSSATTITSVVTKLKPGDEVVLTVDRALENQSGLSITVVLSEYQVTE